MAVFDVAQNVVSQSAGVIISDAGIDISGVVGNLETQLADWSVGAPAGAVVPECVRGAVYADSFPSVFFLVIYGRMIEVYCASRSAACNPQAVRGHFGNPAWQAGKEKYQRR